MTMEAYQPKTDVLIQGSTPEELQENIWNYYNSDLNGAINRTITLKTAAWIVDHGHFNDYVMRNPEGEEITAHFTGPGRVVSLVVVPETLYSEREWLPVLHLIRAENKDDIIYADTKVVIDDIIPNPETGQYEVTVNEYEKHPLSLEPDPEALVEVFDKIFGHYEQAQEKSDLLWSTLAFSIEHAVPQEHHEEIIDAIEEQVEEPEWDEEGLAHDLVQPMLERDVAAYHFANLSTLQKTLDADRRAYLELIGKYMGTWKENPGGGTPLLMGQDHNSKKIRDKVMNKWRQILADVAARNEWTAYMPPMDKWQEQRFDHLTVYVTDGESTALICPDLRRGESRSVIGFGSKYGIRESHLHKWASLYEGIHTGKEGSGEHKILGIEHGGLTDLRQVPTVEQLRFFEKVLAAYL